MMTTAKRNSGAADDIRVLFVEDDPTVAQMYRLKLELDGYQVVMAKDGEEGLKLAAKLKPDIIFLDIRLPKMGGLEYLIKSQTPPARLSSGVEGWLKE